MKSFPFPGSLRVAGAGRVRQGAAEADGHGLKNPESVCVGPGPDRKVFVTIIGEFDKDGDGAVDGPRAGRQGRAVRHRTRRPEGDRAATRTGSSSPTRRRCCASTRPRRSRRPRSSRPRTKFPVAADVPQRHRDRPRERHRSTSATPARTARAARSTASHPKTGAVTLVRRREEAAGPAHAQRPA